MRATAEETASRLTLLLVRCQTGRAVFPGLIRQVDIVFLARLCHRRYSFLLCDPLTQSFQKHDKQASCP